MEGERVLAKRQVVSGPDVLVLVATILRTYVPMYQVFVAIRVLSRPTTSQPSLCETYACRHVLRRVMS